MIRKPYLLFAVLALALAAGPAGATAQGPAIPLTSVDPTLAHVASECPILCPGPAPALFGAVPSHLTAFGDKQFFAAADPDHGAEPWISDGTVEGTFRLADVFPGEGGSDPVPIGIVESPEGPRLLFWASSLDAGREPWITDGTPAGTRMLLDLSPGASSSFSRPGAWWHEEPGTDEADPAGVLFDGELYFGSHRGLHATDGTDAGTRPVGTPCDTDGCTVEVSWLSVSTGRIWFVYEDGPSAPGVDWELGSSDGTTVQFHDTNLEPEAWPPLVPHEDGIAMAVFELDFGVSPCSEAPRVGPPPVSNGIVPPSQTCVVAVAEQENRYLGWVAGHQVTFAGWQDGLVVSMPDPAGGQLWIVRPGRAPEPLVALAPSTQRVARFFPAEDDLYLVGDEGGVWRVSAGTSRVEGLGGPVQQVLPPDLTLLGGERPLWAERFEPIVTPPASDYFWDLKSWVAEPFQRFVTPHTGPGDRERFPLAPSMEPVGDKLFLSADAGEGHQLWVMDLAEVDTGCLATGGVHCLRAGRFEVRVRYANQHDGGTEGDATPVAPYESGDTGYFWFFRPDNLELAVKVLDGRPVNGHWWVFSGGSTDLEYTLEVRDRWTDEVRSYHHAPGDLCSVVDTEAFLEDDGTFGAVAAPVSAAPPLLSAAGDPARIGAPLTPVPDFSCTALDPYACLGPEDRFVVRVRYTNQHAGNQEGEASLLDRTADSAFFRFFPNGGAETMVKVLDGRTVNGHWWVLWGGLTNLGYEVEIFDLQTFATKTFTNAVGSTCGGADLTAFPEDP